MRNTKRNLKPQCDVIFSCRVQEKLRKLEDEDQVTNVLSEKTSSLVPINELEVQADIEQEEEKKNFEAFMQARASKEKQ